MRNLLIYGLGLVLTLVTIVTARAQLPEIRIGEVVPRDVREMYDRGLQYLAKSQTENGDWTDGHNGPGITGMCLMCFLASGEDPNFGVYSNNVRKAVRNIVNTQNQSTGYYGNSMYHHGFAMLGVAEAYGTVDDRNFYTDAPAGQPRSLGRSLELAVRAAITSQKKNPVGGWRYSPDSTDADTSVSGAVLVGLLAARNAGVEVPDEAMNRAVSYYQTMTSTGGQVGYSGIGGHGESLARSSIASLVYALARRKDLEQYKSTVRYLTGQLEQAPSSYVEYTRYYQSQALFQADLESWEKWNRLLVRQLKQAQQADGGIQGDFGKSTGTALSLLSLALNYRFLPIYER
jgi:hypothetical protein